MNHTKIVAGKTETYNRKFRRAIAAIERERKQPRSAKRCFAKLSNLIGGKRMPGHEALVTAFFAEL